MSKTGKKRSDKMAQVKNDLPSHGFRSQSDNLKEQGEPGNLYQNITPQHRQQDR